MRIYETHLRVCHRQSDTGVVHTIAFLVVTKHWTPAV